MFKMKRHQRLYYILFWIGCLLMLNQQTFAIEKTGSISITLPDTESFVSKENVKFGLVLVAKMENGHFELLEKFQQTQIDLNQIETTIELDEAAKKLQQIAKDMSPLEMITNQDGFCTIQDLEVGVYLVYPIDLASYERIQPVLVAIPSFLDEKQQMSYDLQLIPKHSPIFTSIQVKKVSQENTNQTLKNAKFGLYKDKACTQGFAFKETNQSGIAVFENLRRGTYYLKEIGAPQGYQLNPKVFEISLDEKYDEEVIYEIVVSNQPLAVVQTGDTSNFDFYLMVCLFSVVGTVIIYHVSKKRRK